MDRNAMLFRARWHYVEKFDLNTGLPVIPVLYSTLNYKMRQYRFGKTAHLKACEAPTSYDQWLLIAKTESVNCLTLRPWLFSSELSFFFLESEEDYVMTKMAFVFHEDEYGFGRAIPDNWVSEGIARIT